MSTTNDKLRTESRTKDEYIGRRAGQMMCIGQIAGQRMSIGQRAGQRMNISDGAGQIMSIKYQIKSNIFICLKHITYRK